MESILLGVTDRTILVFIPDPASTDGSGKTGLTHSDLTVSYVRTETDNDVTVTDVTSSLSTLTALTDAHSDWGVKEVSATLAPGLYRLDVADAVFASGAWYAVVYVQITSGLAAAVPKAFQLVAANDADLAAIKAVTDKLDDTLEDDAGTYRFTTNALEQAPSGGGGSGDWTADELTAIRTILGVPASGTTPDDPSDGVLKDIKDIAAKLDDTLEDDGGTFRFTANALEEAPSAGGSADWTADEKTAIKTILGVPASGTTPDTPTDGALKDILGDTNELQTDLADGGRLDLLIDAVPSTASIATAVWGFVIENSKTATSFMRLMYAALCNKSALSGSTRTYRDDADSKDRITATTDTSGQRTAVTKDAS